MKAFADAVKSLVTMFARMLEALFQYNSTNRCEICDCPFKKNSYTWNDENGTVRVCPNCNATLEKQKSDAAFSGAVFQVPRLTKRDQKQEVSFRGYADAIFFICIIGFALFSYLFSRWAVWFSALWPIYEIIIAMFHWRGCVVIRAFNDRGIGSTLWSG